MNQERILMRSPSVSAELQRAEYRVQKERKLPLAETAEKEGGQKSCFLCKTTKPLAEFYKHPQMADGHLGKCKECTKRGVHNRYKSPDGREAIRKYEAERFHFPSRKQVIRKTALKSRNRNPEKYKARKALGNAVKCGKILRQPCDICGDPKSQGHHHDYSKPLDVRWLCFKHHRELEHGQIVG